MPALSVEKATAMSQWLKDHSSVARNAVRPAELLADARSAILALEDATGSKTAVKIDRVKRIFLALSMFEVSTDRGLEFEVADLLRVQLKLVVVGRAIFVKKQPAPALVDDSDIEKEKDDLWAARSPLARELLTFLKP